MNVRLKMFGLKNFEKLTDDQFPNKNTENEELNDYINKSIKYFLEEKHQILYGKSLLEVIPDSSILIKDKLTFKGFQG